MRSWSPLFAAPCVAVVAVMTAAACTVSSKAETVGEASPASPAVPVTTARVEQRSMPLAISVVGTAEASATVAVRAQITGALMSVNFKEGDEVQKGQVLFSLDRRPLEAALQQALATLERDTAQATNAHAIAERQRDLQARGIATREQADQSRTTAAALAATLQADRAAVENAKVQLQYATIAAPISGRTGALMVHEGNLVRANDTTPLVVINQVAPIFVSFGVPEARLPELRRYMRQGAIRVEAVAPSETKPSMGQVTFIDNAVDATTGQIKVKASFANGDRRLWPGQFANVSVLLSTDADAMVVPTAAVQSGQQGNYVFVVKPDKTVDLRPVAVARQQAEATVVREGLDPGDEVVTDGQLRLVAGTKVTIRTPSAQPGREGQP